MQRFILTVEGVNLEEVEEIELSGLPLVGEPIETNLGTCVVTKTETISGGSYVGKIVCRMT